MGYARSMAASPLADLAALSEGLRMLRRRPRAVLALLLAGAVLAAVGPLLQRWSGRSDPMAVLLLGAAGMLPWELYVLPRFLARVDAEERDRADNPAQSWRDHFEARWLRTVAVKVGLNLAVGFGLLALLVPGLLVLFAFGWAPYRVLLRGESFGVALRGSLAMMREGWRRALLMVGATFAVAFGGILALQALVAVFHPAPGPLPLGSPLRWGVELVSVALSLWLSTALLAAYQRLEAVSYAEPSSSK